MKSRIIQEPIYEPVSLPEVKSYIRVTHTLEDDLIWSMAKSARKKCEEIARISISPQEWLVSYRAPEVRGDEFNLTTAVRDPERILTTFMLPRPPVVAITSLSLIGRGGLPSLLLVFGVDYFLNANWNSVEWSDDIKRELVRHCFPSVEATYTTGYPLLNLSPGAPPDRTIRQVDCEETLHEAILVTVAHVYDNRGTEGSQIPQKAIELLTPFYNQPRMLG